MALTAYCKKCAREVDAGEICPICGTRLGKNATHAAWCVERIPVRDWICWNALMRILLPAALVILLLALAFAALLLQGKELTDYVVDNRGIHEIHYLPDPTPVKLLVRLKPLSLMKTAEQDGKAAVLKLGEKDLPWRNVARVQLWPEKGMILYYAPSWWMRIAVACTPFSWNDVMALTREKLGKKRKIKLPSSLVIPAEPRTRRTVSRPAYIPDPEPEESPGQLSIDTLFDDPPENPEQT